MIDIEELKELLRDNLEVVVDVDKEYGPNNSTSITVSVDILFDGETIAEGKDERHFTGMR